jgi:hypothetical protein
VEYFWQISISVIEGSPYAETRKNPKAEKIAFRKGAN